MKASYGVDVSSFRNSSKVWSQDAMLRDVSSATMSERETEEVTKYYLHAVEYLIRYLVQLSAHWKATKTLPN